FGHGAEVLHDAVVKRQFVAAHNGLRTVIWQQQVDQIPVFEALLTAHTTKNAELVSVASHFLPDPEAARDAGRADGRDRDLTPTITARQAGALAAQNIGETLTAGQVTAVGTPAPAPDQHQQFKASPLKGEA